MSHRGLPTDFESFLTWEALTEVLSYDPATGEFRWIKSGRLGWVGRIAGCIDICQGYRRIEILGRSFFASRLAWLYMTKKWPRALVDHKNGNRADDRWANLHQASRLENRYNWAIHRKARGIYQGAPIRDSAKSNIVQVSAPAKRPPRRGKPNDFESFLTHEILVSILSYDPATGEFRWRDNKTNPKRIKIGQLAGKATDGQYSDIQILGRKFRAHRLAWFYMTRHWPKALVDHKNGIKSDNRWGNLREATKSQNGYNQARRKENSSGVVGVYAHGNNWRAMAGNNNKIVQLGTYKTVEEAKNAREEFDARVVEDFKRSVNT